MDKQFSDMSLEELQNLEETGPNRRLSCTTLLDEFEGWVIGIHTPLPSGARSVRRRSETPVSFLEIFSRPTIGPFIERFFLELIALPWWSTWRGEVIAVFHCSVGTRESSLPEVST